MRRNWIAMGCDGKAKRWGFGEPPPESKTPRLLRTAAFVPSYAGRGERIRTSGLYVPNVALYQAKLHPEV